MKTATLATLAATVLLFSCHSGKKEKNDLSEMNLSGKVKSLKAFTYEAVEKFGEVTKGERDERVTTHHIFNGQGNKIEENLYKADGSLEEKLTYQYDSKGNKIE